MKHFPRWISVSLLIALLVLICTGCGAGQKTLKIANVDKDANTFDLVDTRTRQTIQYDKLILEDKEVVDWLCTEIMGGHFVVLATEPGQIVRDGDKVTFSGHGYGTTVDLKYELKDGTLTILGEK